MCQYLFSCQCIFWHFLAWIKCVMYLVYSTENLVKPYSTKENVNIKKCKPFIFTQSVFKFFKSGWIMGVYYQWQTLEYNIFEERKDFHFCIMIFWRKAFSILSNAIHCIDFREHQSNVNIVWEESTNKALWGKYLAKWILFHFLKVG